MFFIATAAFGLEGLVKQELQSLGFQATAEQGAARFESDFAGAFRANLYLRCADRVQWLLGEKEILSFEELFNWVYEFPWGDILPKNAASPIKGHCARSQLMSVSDCQSITKKAIVQKLKQRYKLNWFEENGAVYPISITFHRDRARICLETSGEALNKRGYRTWNGEAPIRETLAAALVMLSPWKPGEVFHDPCCGTGTLLVEAAYIASNRASGLGRSFMMESWDTGAEQLNKQERERAKAAFDPQKIESISGSDISEEVLDICKRHLKQAGLQGRVRVEQADLRKLQLEGKAPCFIANPPYGHRIGGKDGGDINKALGQLQFRHPESRLCVISAAPGLEKQIGKRAQQKRRLYNGRLECEYLIF